MYNLFSCLCNGMKYEQKEEKIHRKDHSCSNGFAMFVLTIFL
jgi:hypothetical protein